MELIIDTATRFASVAVAKESEIVGSSSWESERNHSVELVPSINTLLSRLKITTDQIESVYITVGPGRFSALRVGISTAKSFAKTREIPLVPLNTLEVEAIPYIHLGLPTYALIGAGKSKVYSARYPEGSITTGILLFKSETSKTLEEKKLTSTILPTKFFLCNTAIPFFIPLLLPLFKMNDLRYGLFLSSITRALTKLPGDSTSSSINFLN